MSPLLTAAKNIVHASQAYLTIFMHDFCARTLYKFRCAVVNFSLYFFTEKKMCISIRILIRLQ